MDKCDNFIILPVNFKKHEVSFSLQLFIIPSPIQLQDIF